MLGRKLQNAQVLNQNEKYRVKARIKKVKKMPCALKYEFVVWSKEKIN